LPEQQLAHLQLLFDLCVLSLRCFQLIDPLSQIGQLVEKLVHGEAPVKYCRSILPEVCESTRLQ
jgi:hypothetical protein